MTSKSIKDISTILALLCSNSKCSSQYIKKEKVFKICGKKAKKEIKK
jgi:hypothetical protein